MSELLNRTIGGYKLLEQIGGGGVAEVFRAQPVAGAPRDVAVKVIFPEFARQPGVAANFARIGQAAAQLANHPHILPVIGSGEDHEFLYLVTPLVREGSLATWLRSGGRLGVSDAAPFFQQLCGAVSFAHSLGLTHGNLKPSNVYLFEGRHVLLGDFGLLWDVRALDPSWSGSDVAAFEYFAPEVFNGLLTPASDIYSLGATLYASLTGHAPFHARKLGELIAAAREQAPPSLAQETPALAPAIVALDAVVRQAMAKQPEQRFATAVALGQSIEITLRNAPPTAPAAMGQASSTPLASGQQYFGQQGAPGPGLAHLDPPFPPLPSAMGPDSAMELGGSMLAAGASNIVFPAPPTSPVDGPTMRIAAPSTSPVDGPTMRIVAPPLDPQFGPQYDPQGDGGLALDFGSQAARRPISAGGRMDSALAQVAPEPARGALSGPFSATELGLPRLTNPALENLPPDWRDLVTDESARKRHDPFEMSGASLAPLPAIDPLGDSRADLDYHDDPASWGAESEAGGRPWDPSAAESAEMANVRGGHADYDIERMAQQRPATRSRVRDEVKGDGLDSQRVWTNSWQIVRGKRRSKAPFLTIVALLALAALEMVGLSLGRPDICVTHACTVVAGYAHRAAPWLRIPGATAPVRVSPGVPAVSVVTEGSSQVTVTLINSSADPITWKVAPTLLWMSVSPASGALKGGAVVPLKVTVSPHGVAPGLYTAALVVTVGDGLSEEPLLVTVKPGAALSVAKRALSFSRCGQTQSLTVTNSGGAQLSYQAAPSVSGALSVSPGAGALAPGKSAALAVSMICGAATGQTYAVIIVSDGGSAQVIVTYS